MLSEQITFTSGGRVLAFPDHGMEQKGSKYFTDLVQQFVTKLESQLNAKSEEIDQRLSTSASHRSTTPKTNAK